MSSARLVLYKTSNINSHDGKNAVHFPREVRLGEFDLSHPVFFGRGSNDKPVDVRLDLKRDGRELISRRHCELNYSEEKKTWVVKDLGALNGVFVNGKKVEKKWTLKNGDILQLAGTESDSDSLRETSIRFMYEATGCGSPDKRKRGASQNSADSLGALPPSKKATKEGGSRSGSTGEMNGNGSSSQISYTSAQSASLVRENESLRKEQMRLKKEERESRRKAEGLQSQVETLDHELSRSKKEAAKASKLAKDLEKEKQQMEEENESFIDELHDKLEEKKREIVEKKDFIGELAGKNKELEKRLKGLSPTGKHVIDDSALEAMISCPLCSEPMLDAVVTACSHGFCRLCLEDCVKRDMNSSDRQVCCPVCSTNPMGSKTHLYYFRSKHLDDVVSLYMDAAVTGAKEVFELRQKKVHAEMLQRGLSVDARHGVMGVSMGKGSAIEQFQKRGGTAEKEKEKPGEAEAEAVVDADTKSALPSAAAAVTTSDEKEGEGEGKKEEESKAQGAGGDKEEEQPQASDQRYAADAPAEKRDSDESKNSNGDGDGDGNNKGGQAFCSHCGTEDHKTASCPEVLENSANHSQPLAAM